VCRYFCCEIAILEQNVVDVDKKNTIIYHLRFVKILLHNVTMEY